MVMCEDCRHLQRGYGIADHICARPSGARRLAARERYSKHERACTQLGKFFEPATRRCFGDDE